MRLCLTCKYMSPGDAAFCAHCARSFVGRRCPRGHLAPMNAICCPQCGRGDMSAGTPSLNLRAPVLLIGAGITLAVCIPLGQALLPHAAHAAESFSLTLRGMMNVGILLAIVLYLLPGRFGRDVRRSVSRSLRSLWRLFVGLHLLRLLGRMVRTCTLTGSVRKHRP
jgi:hypothetical protein